MGAEQHMHRERDSWSTSVRHVERDLKVLSITVAAFEKAERQRYLYSVGALYWQSGKLIDLESSSAILLSECLDTLFYSYISFCTKLKNICCCCSLCISGLRILRKVDPS